MKKIALSLLDLAVVKEGGNAASAIRETVETAQRVEQLGYNRIWLAEHHNAPNIASSATAVLIGHVASQTKKIRVGSGGIMLPNHAPLIVAEQFGTLASIYPNRIDLGLGRAPGTDQPTAYAIRRKNFDAHFQFADDIRELQSYFKNGDPNKPVRAFPGEGLNIPFWVLGSSTDSAYLAAELGLPYVFAAHFAPAELFEAIRIYRERFEPSEQLSTPYVSICVNVIGAESNEDAEWLSTSFRQMIIGIITGKRKPLQPPHQLQSQLTMHPQITAHLRNMTAATFIGDESRLKSQLHRFVQQTDADELITTAYIFDKDAKFQSLEMTKKVLE